MENKVAQLKSSRKNRHHTALTSVGLRFPNFTVSTNHLEIF